MSTSLFSFKNLVRVFRARLSIRIVFWIFLSLTVIEAILLVPSVERRKQEILSQIEEISEGKVTWILMTYPEATGAELLTQLQQLAQDGMLRSVILGGAVYEADGTLVGTFGEAPTLRFADARQERPRYTASPQGDRYDVSWTTGSTTEPHTIVLRHNATGTRMEIVLYVLRIAGIVIIISAFVTTVVMVSLGPNLITPILTLQQDLAKAGEAIARDRCEADFQSIQWQRKDELGEVIHTFHRMFDQICQAVSKRKQAEAELRHNNSQMRAYLEDVDQVTTAAVELENGTFQLGSLATVADRSDELGMLARVFQQMAQHIQDREMLLKQQLVELRIEIDQQKREKEVATLTESSYFQEVQNEVAHINLDEYWQ